MLSYVEFWMGTSCDQRALAKGNRVVFSASSRKALEDLSAAPSANGAMSHEAPWVRPDYARDVNAAYARDPGGN